MVEHDVVLHDVLQSAAVKTQKNYLPLLFFLRFSYKVLPCFVLFLSMSKIMSEIKNMIYEAVMRTLKM